MFRSLLLLPFIAAPLIGETIVDPVLFIDSRVSSKATAGVSDRGDPTKDSVVGSTMTYIMRYDGPSEFSADYTIVLDGANRLDPTKSSITFTTINYTSSGTLTKSGFKTPSIPITAAVLDPRNMVQSFTFTTPNMWYTGLPNSLEDTGLTGSIDLAAGTSSYVGSYRNKSNGAVSTYTVVGTIKPADAPEPGPQPDRFGSPEIFSPAPEAVPEPSSVVLLTSGLLAVPLLLRRRPAN